MLAGFDIGGTKCAISAGELTDSGVNIASVQTMPTDTGISPYEMIDRMCESLDSVTDDISAIGISCGGPLDSKKGVIMSPPNLPGWDNVQISDYLGKRYNVPVCIQNDANACAVAEWKFGAGRGCDNMIFLTFGTGLGAGLILDGRLYAGTNDMAGEAGHMRLSPFGPVGYGKAGSFEGFCSGGGIAQLALMKAKEKWQMGKTVSYCPHMGDADMVSAKSVAECARAGHKDAIEIFDICGQKLGEGLSVLIDILNPQKIVIGSIYARCEELLSDAMNKVLKRECLGASLDVCRVVPAKLGDEIGNYAALAVAALNF